MKLHPIALLLRQDQLEAVVKALERHTPDLHISHNLVSRFAGALRLAKALDEPGRVIDITDPNPARVVEFRKGGKM